MDEAVERRQEQCRGRGRGAAGGDAAVDEAAGSRRGRYHGGGRRMAAGALPWTRPRVCGGDAAVDEAAERRRGRCCERGCGRWMKAGTLPRPEQK